MWDSLEVPWCSAQRCFVQGVRNVLVVRRGTRNFQLVVLVVLGVAVVVAVAFAVVAVVVVSEIASCSRHSFCLVVVVL